MATTSVLTMNPTLGWPSTDPLTSSRDALTSFDSKTIPPTVDPGLAQRLRDIIQLGTDKLQSRKELTGAIERYKKGPTSSSQAHSDQSKLSTDSPLLTPSSPSVSLLQPNVAARTPIEGISDSHPSTTPWCDLVRPHDSEIEEFLNDHFGTDTSLGEGIPDYELIIRYKRHEQGEHNISRTCKIPDAPLTTAGTQRAEDGAKSFAARYILGELERPDMTLCSTHLENQQTIAPLRYIHDLLSIAETGKRHPFAFVDQLREQGGCRGSAITPQDLDGPRIKGNSSATDDTAWGRLRRERTAHKSQRASETVDTIAKFADGYVKRTGNRRVVIDICGHANIGDHVTGKLIADDPSFLLTGGGGHGFNNGQTYEYMMSRKGLWEDSAGTYEPTGWRLLYNNPAKKEINPLHQSFDKWFSEHAGQLLESVKSSGQEDSESHASTQSHGRALDSFVAPSAITVA